MMMMTEKITTMAESEVTNIAEFQKILQQRSIVTLKEASDARELKPRNVSLDLLLVKTEQMDNKLLREVEMKCLKHFQDGQGETPKVSSNFGKIKEILMRLGSDQDTLAKGMIFLCGKGNEHLKRIYSQQNELAQAKSEVTNILRNKDPKGILVYVTMDVVRLFEETDTITQGLIKVSLIEFDSKSIDEKFDIVRTTLDALQNLQGDISYLSPEQLKGNNPVLEKLFAVGEYLKETLENIEKSSLGMQSDMITKIESLNKRIEGLQNEKTNLVNEWEEQRDRMERTANAQGEKMNSLKAEMQSNRTEMDERESKVHEALKASLEGKNKELNESKALVTELQKRIGILEEAHEITVISVNISKHLDGWL